MQLGRALGAGSVEWQVVSRVGERGSVWSEKRGAGEGFWGAGHLGLGVGKRDGVKERWQPGESVMF